MVRRVGGGRENRRDMGVAHRQVHTTNLDNAIILWVVGLVGVCGVAGQATTTTPSGTTTVAYAIGDGPPPLSANCTGNSVTAEGILQGTRRYASISVRYDTTAVVNVTWTVQNPVALQGGSVEFVSRSGLYTINVGATTEVQDTFTFNQTGTPPTGPALQTLCRLSIGVVRVETTVTSTTSTASSRTTSSTTISSTSSVTRCTTVERSRQLAAQRSPCPSHRVEPQIGSPWEAPIHLLGTDSRVAWWPSGRKEAQHTHIVRALAMVCDTWVENATW
eukprot:m.335052 g.335052  ORF g.335052 m.335052 type:complete len:276 (+) comp27762_c0_seq13:164-991(+)